MGQRTIDILQDETMFSLVDMRNVLRETCCPYVLDEQISYPRLLNFHQDIQYF